MLRKVSVWVVLITLWLCLFTACKKTESDNESNELAPKTMAEYETEAEKEINEDNMQEELNKLQDAIEKDINQEP
jgi:hypothetical protein